MPILAIVMPKLVAYSLLYSENTGAYHLSLLILGPFFAEWSLYPHECATSKVKTNQLLLQLSHYVYSAASRTNVGHRPSTWCARDDERWDCWHRAMVCSTALDPLWYAVGAALLRRAAPKRRTGCVGSTVLASPV